MSMTPSAQAQEGTSAVVTGTAEDRLPIFSLLAKRTYDIAPGQAPVRAGSDRPLLKADVYYAPDDPEFATVKHEAELIPYKPATDVVVIGKAYAPRGKPAEAVDVAAEVSGRRKALRVVGDRRCQYRANRAPSFTDPVPFVEMEIRYEKAYGGKDLRSDPALPFF